MVIVLFWGYIDAIEGKKLAFGSCKSQQRLIARGALRLRREVGNLLQLMQRIVVSNSFYLSALNKL